MPDKFLYETLDAVSQMGFLKKEIPNYLSGNLNPVFELRPYQVEALPASFTVSTTTFRAKSRPCISCLIWRPAAARRSSWRA